MFLENVAAYKSGSLNVPPWRTLKLARCQRLLAASLAALPSMSFFPFTPLPVSYRGAIRSSMMIVIDGRSLIVES